MRIGSLSLGTKLNIALLAFLLVLGGATSAIIIYGFNRTQDNANERSREALEEEGKLALEALVGGLADAGALQLEYAAEVGQRAGRYLHDFQATGATAQYEVSRYVQTEDDVWYDPDPERISDIVIPNHVPVLEGAVLDDIAFSAPLDAIFPALAEGFPGQLSGDAFHPFAIIFIGVNGVGRYYPPIGISETTPAELDVSDFFDRFGPVTNPSRESFWTPPYEDLNGRGLVITAQTPIYDGDTFRGIFEVDLSIAALVEQINELKPTPSGFTFYIDSEGEIMRTDAYDLLTREAEQNEDLGAVLDEMKTSTTGTPIVSDRVTLDGEAFFIAHMPMSPIGGSIAVAAPVDEVTAQAATITAGIDEEANRTFWITLASMGGIFVAGLAGATYLNRRVLVAPIQRLAAATRAVAAGDLETRVEPGRGKDELRELADSFNAMVEQLRESERLLERRVEERTRELEALLEVSRRIAAEITIDDLAQTLVRVAGELFDTTGASVASIDEHGIATHLGSNNPNLAEYRIAPGFTYDMAASGLLWNELRQGRGILIDDVRGESALAAAYRDTMGDAMDGIYRDVRSWMAAPFVVKERVIGWLVVSHNEPGRYTEGDLAVARAMANQAAVALENARLFEEAQQAASLEERQRLARELHDSVSQALYGIALGARTAREQLAREPAKAVEPVDYVLSLAEAGLAEMRALIFELRPESLASEGLVAALDKQVAATRARFAFDVESSLCDEPEVPIETKEALYRIAQEALHNVVKHAKARHASVSLQSNDGALTLAVHDDGIGFDPDADYAGHLGLHSMRERAMKAGGELTVASGPGSGTTVQVRVPAG